MTGSPPGGSPRGPLGGWRVLVPRGGPWGEAVAADLRARGAEPLVVPLVGFAPPDDPEPLRAAVAELRRGGYDWLVVTSATTVDALLSAAGTLGTDGTVGTSGALDTVDTLGPGAADAVVPSATRVAAVGPATRAACERAGIQVDLVPATDRSAVGLAGELPPGAGRVLLPQSDLAAPDLAEALTARGARVTAVVAYRTVAAAVDDAARAAVRAGHVDAVLVTSGSVAREVAAQLGPLPATTLVVCLGPRTAAEAEAAGLDVALVARERSAASLVDALAEHAGHTGRRA